ncbi:extracellular metallo proteinase 5 [Microdochium trichocladiopsis]|uniref:Extracellular metalloproteinase n=1 Tax=Microdochium trichocladiopsis TaxID=1682393 RepID=A0A9P8Y5S1_9PEZI|nr:extracellular metallo proteinase 5 [Microdochium trichocladiopsis]KAH7030685.1 extracellular metallo proteinase 5 [Microdochium trichocladiopsis]
MLASKNFAVLLLALFGGSTHVAASDLSSAYRFRPAPGYTKASDVAANQSVQRLVRRGDYIDTATALVASTEPNTTYRVVGDHYIGANGIGHVNFKQTIGGLDIDNADFSVHVARDGSIFSYSNAFVAAESISRNALIEREALLDPVAAVEVVLATFSYPVSGTGKSVAGEDENSFSIEGISGLVERPQVRLSYMVEPAGDVTLAWQVEVRHARRWLSAHVAAQGEARVLGVMDFHSHATYQVFPWGINDPSEGTRTVVQDPQDTTSSPKGWHADGLDANTTIGNNAQVGAVPDNSGLVHFPDSDTLDFQFPYSPADPTPRNYLEAACTQVFYIINMAHDLYYSLGFTEAAGNMQADNFDKGGRPYDRVQASIQLWSGMNNGIMTRTIDGRVSYMELYIFDKTVPKRDVAFDSGFVIHEYTHGLTNRLTGGPANGQCLDSYEADGMAEGWSDLFAAAVAIKPQDTPATAYYGFAGWPLGAANETARIALYSTDTGVNGLTYKAADNRQKVHEIGTVWATMLYEVLWNLIDKHGKNDGPKPVMGQGGVPTDGKYLMLKLLTDSFALQPCNPTFIQSRDAILDADLANTGGVNKCEIWRGFAKRGLGVNAVFRENGRVDNFDLPQGC